MPRPLEERFAERLSECSTTDRGCIVWNGSVNDSGYGIILEGGRGTKPLRASRVAWQFARGPIPINLFVLHECDNPRCVNVAHLFLGTHQDNMADMASKGRAGNIKLTKDKVLRIRRMAADGEASRRIAERFGVSKGTVLQIVNRITWRHI